jgi:hypothetical protein
VVEQIVYLGPDTISFAEPCEACLSVEEGSVAARHRASVVEGTLRTDVDVGFRTCRRGHRIVVRRMRASAKVVQLR